MLAFPPALVQHSRLEEQKGKAAPPLGSTVIVSYIFLSRAFLGALRLSPIPFKLHLNKSLLKIELCDVDSNPHNLITVTLWHTGLGKILQPSLPKGHLAILETFLVATVGSGRGLLSS